MYTSIHIYIYIYIYTLGGGRAETAVAADEEGDEARAGAPVAALRDGLIHRMHNISYYNLLQVLGYIYYSTTI